MKIVFFGTPDYVLPILDSLNKEFKNKEGTPIVAVVTQSPKPEGRKHQISYSPVDDWAHKRGVQKYFNPMDIVTNNISADIGILASYAKIIPKEVINHFRYGIVNIHPSLLPVFKGASPIQATILTEQRAGISFMKIDEKLDHGQIISQFYDELTPEDTNESLRKRLFERAGDIIPTLIPAYVSDKIKLTTQDEKKAVYTYEIKRDDGFIPSKYLSDSLIGKIPQDTWEIPFIKKVKQRTEKIKAKTEEHGALEPYKMIPDSVNLDRFIRALTPWPGVWSLVKIKNQELRIKILKAEVASSKCLLPTLVQLEGKNAVSWEQFIHGYPKFTFSL